MTRDDFKRHLNQLRGVIVRGLWNYEIRKALSPPEEVTVETLNRFNRFFVPVCTAVLQIMVIQFAEAFDRDRRAISLRRLVKAAQEYQCLIPYASPGQIDAIGQRLSYLKNSKVLESIKRLRDQRWAHLDADPLVFMTALFGIGLMRQNVANGMLMKLLEFSEKTQMDIALTQMTCGTASDDTLACSEIRRRKTT